MQCQTCGLALDPQQVAQTGRCPRCGTAVQSGTNYGQSYPYGQQPTVLSPPPQPEAYSSIPPPPPPPYGAPPAPYGVPTQQGYGSPQQGFGAPPAPYGAQPQGFGAPPPFGAPGVIVAPPRKSKTGLIVIIAVVVVVIVGGVIGVVALTGKKSGNNNGSSGVSLKTFTSPDGSFKIGYPTDWKQTASPSGAGAEFASSDGQLAFIVFNGGPSEIDPAEADSAGCQGGGGTAGSPQTVTIGGQNWTREECNNSSGTLHLVVEGVIVNGNFFFIDYAGPTSSFDSNRSQYFTPMEQSFNFTS